MKSSDVWWRFSSQVGNSTKAVAGLLAVTLTANGCGPAPTPVKLGDADAVRLQAVLEVTSPTASRAVCLAVDPSNVTTGNAIDAEWRSTDPTGTFAMAVQRLGNVYPESHCATTLAEDGGAVIQKEAPKGMVRLGPVFLDPRGDRAHLQVFTREGELMGELRLFQYVKRDAEWVLDRNILQMQE